MSLLQSQGLLAWVFMECQAVRRPCRSPLLTSQPCMHVCRNLLLSRDGTAKIGDVGFSRCGT
jgi:hypothetical protein